MNYPVFKLVIEDEDDPKDGIPTEVNYVAIVDDPAIQRNFIAFNNSKPIKFQTANAEKRIICGPLMIPNLPIYRRDEQMGEYYVVFDKESIYKILLKFCRKGFFNNVNLMHDPNRKVSDVYMVQTFLIDSELGITTPKGFDTLPDGTWFAFYRVDNDDLWNNYIKTGEFRGFSVEGMFEYVPQKPMEDTQIKAIEDAIQGFIDMLETPVK